MQFSEAIRLGSMMKPQLFGMLTDGVGSCALGAAQDAVGRDWRTVFETHQALDARCPVCGQAPVSLTSPVYDSRGLYFLTPAHLNDDHRWTREQIADWVESVERASAQSGAAVWVEIATG